MPKKNKIYIPCAGDDQVIQTTELATTHFTVQAAICNPIWENEKARKDFVDHPKKHSMII